MDAALELARTLAERSPFAIGVVKELAARRATCSLAEGLRARGEGVRPLPRERGRRRGRDGVPREAQAAVHRSMKAVVLHEIGAPAGRRGRARARPGRGTVARRGARGGDQLRGRPDPARPLSAAAAAAGRARLRGRRRPRRPARDGDSPGTRGGYAERVAVDDEWVFDLPAGGELRRGRSVPDDVPDGVDPARPTGAHPAGLARARDRGGRRRRHGGDPARPPPRRARHGSGRLRGEARARAAAGRRGDDLATRRSASSTTSTWRSTRSAGRSSPPA